MKEFYVFYLTNDTNEYNKQIINAKNKDKARNIFNNQLPKDYSELLGIVYSRDIKEDN